MTNKITKCYMARIRGIAVAAALLSVGFPAHAIPVSAVSISGGSVLADGDTNGWRFQARSSISVVSLGTWDENADGLPSQVNVGLWSDAGTLLASLTLGAGTSAALTDGFRYQSLVSPVALTAGAFYRVAASVNSGTIQYREGVTVAAAPDIAYDDGFYAGSSNSLTFPSNPGAIPNFPDFFGANFRYESASVPVGGTLGLFAVGLFGLAGRRSTRRR